MRNGHGPAKFQRDASEFIFALFGEISRCCLASFAFANAQQLTRAELTLPQYRLFGFDYATTTCCDSCGTTTRHLDRQTMLTIPLRRAATAISLTLLLNDLFASERMVGDNQFKCSSESCNGRKSDATRTATIDNTSSVLILQLMRFNSAATKIDTPVSFPLSIDVGRFMSDKRSLTYELVR